MKRMNLGVYVVFWYFYLFTLPLSLKSGLGIWFREICKQEGIDDEEKIRTWHYFSLLLAKWYFCVYLFFMCITSFGMLYWITDKYSSYGIIQSGLVVPIWLLLTGIIIRKVYYFLGNKSSVYIWLDKSFDEKQMSVYWIVVPIISALVYLMYDFNLVLMVIAIILGKYIWLDTVLNVKKVKSKVKECIQEDRDSLEILGLFAIRAVGGGASYAIYYHFFIKKGITDAMLFIFYSVIMCIIISLVVDHVILRIHAKRKQEEKGGE